MPEATHTGSEVVGAKRREAKEAKVEEVDLKAWDLRHAKVH